MFRTILSDGARAAIKSSIHNRVFRHPILERRLVDRATALGITDIIDVGANLGQFAKRMRSHGWRGKIHSFEPLPDAYTKLRKLGKKDDKHFTHNFALGHFDSSDAKMNVASNHGASSSLLNFKSVLSESFDVHVVKTEMISIRRLDEVCKELEIPVHGSILKLDVQGFETEVMNGAGISLQDFPIIFLETSYVPMYDREPTLFEMAAFLNDRGFDIRDVESSVFRTPYDPMQCDIVCVNRKHSIA